jgi:short-subunit dehydrogenase
MDASEAHDRQIAGQRVLVTGGSTGIGQAIALALTREGARVLVCGRSREDIDATLDRARGTRGDISGISVDLSNISDVNKLFDEVDGWLGGLDVLINNAAVGSGAVGETSLEDIEYTVRTNLIAPLACTHKAVERMGSDDAGGIIVNIGSMSANVREEGSSVYVATKAAIQAFSEALRKEVNSNGIAVTLIEPGATGTDMQPIERSEQRDLEEKGEMLEDDDVAEAVLFCLTRPRRADIVSLQIRPHLQYI